MKVYVFPGQGAQKLGMGEDLFDLFPDYLARADDILGYSVRDLCLRGDEKRLNDTEFTQPALFTVSALAFMKKVREYGYPADFFAGHSLGEYNALFASGAFDFDAALRIVKKRGELMARASGGGMAAIIGLQAEDIERVLHADGHASLDVANFNAPSQTVISGPLADIDAAQDSFERAGGSLIPLPVSAPFHSRYMREMAQEFSEYLGRFRFNPLRVPVISNVTARPYQDGQLTELLTKQLYSSVRWVDSVRYLIDLGADDFEELGPGTVLTDLIRKIDDREAAKVSA